MDTNTEPETLVDFITGRSVPNMGAEENRQAVERFLVEEKGFAKDDIEVDTPIELDIAGEVYRSMIDLAVHVAGKVFMCIKCAPGSLGSREREIVAAARLLAPYQVPFAVVSDGKTAVVIETVSGKKIAEGLSAIPARDDAQKSMEVMRLAPFPEERRRREGLIFRSYDSMNVNRMMNG
jgi:hypothetical protein